MARRVVAAAVAVLGMVCALPAVARAAPPVCPDAVLETDPGVPLELPKPACTGAVEPIQVSIPPGGNPTRGTISERSPGVFVYTPTNGPPSVDQFQYQVRSSTGELSNVATVQVIVDRAPTCTSIPVSVAANTPTAIDLPCSDGDGDALDLFASAPAHGTASFSGSRLVYTPAPGYSGPDSITFYAEDDFYSSDDATLTITVSPPPAPVPAKPSPTPAPKDLSAPAVTLKNASKKQALAIAVTSNENASATLTVALDKATARKLKLTQKVGTLKASLKPGTATLKVKLSSKAARAFKKLKSVKLTVTAVVTDAAGNKTTKTLKVTLKK
jgi:hypothetical protein